MSDVYFSPDHEKYISYYTCLQLMDKDFFLIKWYFGKYYIYCTLLLQAYMDRNAKTFKCKQLKRSYNMIIIMII